MKNAIFFKVLIKNHKKKWIKRLNFAPEWTNYINNNISTQVGVKKIIFINLYQKLNNGLN